MQGVLKMHEWKIQISGILSKSIINVLVLKKNHVNFMNAGFDKKDSRADNHVIKAKQLSVQKIRAWQNL